MTWIVSGPARVTIGQDVTQPGAASSAFGPLLETIADDRVFGAESGQTVAAAALRAAARWDGASDDGAIPLYLSPQGREDVRPVMAQGLLDLEGLAAYVEPVFVAVMVPPGVEEVELTFVDDGRNAVFPGGSDWPPVGIRLASNDAYVMVDAFIGANTYRATGLRKVVDGLARVRVRVRNGVASLVGAVLRVPADARSAGSRDVSWTPRLNAARRRYPAEDEKYPRIDLVPAVADAEVVVFVHGTLATCLPALAAAGHHAQLPVFRFEHDTMRPIAENAEELAGALVRAGAPIVKFVGHSRGGLVAVLAGTLYPKTKLVTTFGTPHAGTPLASAMDGLLAYGAVAVGAGVGSLIAGGLTAAVTGSAMPGGRFPDGWAEMEPHSSFIRMLPHLKIPPVHAYGGAFDSSADLGQGPLMGIETAQALFGDLNDLVVPVASSCPPHLPSVKVDQVHHFDYFSKGDLGLWAALSQAMST